MQPLATSRPRQRLRFRLLLILLLAWAVGLRGWYATKDLEVGRFWDERYSVPNVHAVLETGSLEPVEFAYLRLTYLPHALVLLGLETAIQRVEPEFSWFVQGAGRGPVLRPAGFLVCRGLQVVLAGLSILLTYLLGKRLFTAETGLLAAFFVAAAPMHLISSVIFKPDILLLTTTLAAFLWSLEAVEKASLPSYLLAGLGIGLVLSSKPIGGSIAIPLALAALYLGWRERRHWLGLVAAAATSVLVFLILNPYLEDYLRSFRLQRAFYRKEALRLGSLGDPIEIAQHLVGGALWGYHGSAIGLMALAGFLVLGFRAWKTEPGEGTAVPVVMLISYPIGFAVLYGAAAQVVLGQNLLPLLPFTSLAAAALLVNLWRWATGRIGALSGRRTAAVVVATGLVLAVAQRAHDHAYRVMVPRTIDLVLDTVAASLPGWAIQWIYLEDGAPAPPGEQGRRSKRPPAAVRVFKTPNLADLRPRVLDRSDAEAFPLARLRTDPTGFHHSRTERVSEDRVRIIRPAPFRAWGPPMVLVHHPWTPRGSHSLVLTGVSAGEGRRSRGTSVLGGRLASSSPGRAAATISFWLRMPASRTTHRPTLRANGREVELLPAPFRRGTAWTSARFPVATARGTGLELRLPSSLGLDRLKVEVRRWRTPQRSAP